MAPEVSDITKTGGTVMLLAALLAVILNLMAMSTSILNSGQNALQSGVDTIEKQEFSPYDNTVVPGSLVSSALSLFQGRQIGVLVRTKALAEEQKQNYYINYGALFVEPAAGNAAPKKISPDNVGTVYWVKVGETTGATTEVCRKDGNAYYSGNVLMKNGLAQLNYNIKGITTPGIAQQVLSSGRFSSVLIKNAAGAPCGIVFTQVS